MKIDPSNPRILYAATWDHRRLPWKVISGGKGSSVYKSTDSGETWTQITNGLPDMMGKIDLSVSAVNPRRIFALVEAEKEVAGMYTSDDAGATWKLLSNDPNITSRSWYYMEVFTDPNNEEVVYALNAPMMKSIDGGKTFESMRVIHGDCHGFWINVKYREADRYVQPACRRRAQSENRPPARSSVFNVMHSFFLLIQ